MVAHPFIPSSRKAEQIPVSSRPAWSTRASFRTASKAIEKHCLGGGGSISGSISREIVKELRALADLPEDLGLVPKPTGQLTN